MYKCPHIIQVSIVSKYPHNYWSNFICVSITLLQRNVSKSNINTSKQSRTLVSSDGPGGVWGVKLLTNYSGDPHEEGIET